MNRFPLKILAAERVLFDGACQSLVVPTLDGLYGIQAHHENVVIAVVPGTLSLRSGDGEELVAAVSSGILKMENNEALLLVETIEQQKRKM